MGIDLTNLRFLIKAKNRHGPFGDLLQLGRQSFYFAPHQIPRADSCVRYAGLGESLADATGSGHYADERLFGRFGATSITAADASDYDGAGLIHDFNDPLPPEWEQRFDTVIDGGSTEHIFNIATCLANLMRLTRVGGRVLGLIPANNWLGHGFYQFSPELPFRVFVPANGFVVRAVFLAHHDTAELDEVTDTGADGVRSEIGGTRATTSLCYIAEKTAHVRPFATCWPQQGDYDAVWRASAASAAVI